jgi:hypothetical protein
MPVPFYLSGVVIIFAFPRSKSGIFDLILEKISHSQTASKILNQGLPMSFTGKASMFLGLDGAIWDKK